MATKYQFKILELWFVYEAILGLTFDTSALATEETALDQLTIQTAIAATLENSYDALLEIQSNTENNTEELQEVNAKLLDADGLSAGANLRAIFRNTKDWDNSGLTLAQMTLAIYGRLTGTMTGQGGTAVPYGGNVATRALAATALADKINERKGNQAVVFVVYSNIEEKADATYDWTCVIIG